MTPDRARILRALRAALAWLEERAKGRGAGFAAALERADAEHSRIERELARGVVVELRGPARS